ncbi:FHA domain-containing protein [Brachybacterium sp. JHP9]|uniref:FHA domain-containing protein n=1 Tax=Brachybacterium equifaecis TaxID=2910770 RepID=A0ABT0R5U2_9MICO|nr:FHA domain-containing protein [Brachybacterium equifaecis]MCL6424285.1 FHA domain-containing protein [Brachybacterium equifaecis]
MSSPSSLFGIGTWCNPGPAVLVRRDAGWIVLVPGTAPRVVEAAWDCLADSAAHSDFLSVLAERAGLPGADALPELVAALVQPDSIQVIVRGATPLHVHLHDGTAREISAVDGAANVHRLERVHRLSFGEIPREGVPGTARLTEGISRIRGLVDVCTDPRLLTEEARAEIRPAACSAEASPGLPEHHVAPSIPAPAAIPVPAPLHVAAPQRGPGRPAAEENPPSRPIGLTEGALSWLFSPQADRVRERLQRSASTEQKRAGAAPQTRSAADSHDLPLGSDPRRAHRDEGTAFESPSGDACAPHFSRTLGGLFRATRLRTVEQAARRDEEAAGTPERRSAPSPLPEADGAPVRVRPAHSEGNRCSDVPPTSASTALQALRLELSTGETFDLAGPVILGRGGADDEHPASAGSGSRFRSRISLPEICADVSREHLVLAPEGTGAVATDLGARNGTRLHRPGRRPRLLPAHREVPLRVGDALELGGSLRIVLTPGTGEPPGPAPIRRTIDPAPAPAPTERSPYAASSEPAQR